MRLREALQARRGEVISFVGAGGKTTAMYCLGRELACESWRVITTTTTRIRPPSAAQTEALVLESDPARALCLVEEALRAGTPVTLCTQRLEAETKLEGIPCSLAAALVRLADAVIIEADGARGRSLKAPAAHEPVVPSETTLFVPVVGIDAVGRRLTRHVAHRPELVAEVTGVARGEVISASVLADLLVHTQGGLKGAPIHARVMPLINKVEDEVALASARQIAARVKANSSVGRVLIGAVRAVDPVVECWRRVSAIVLAAGASKRFGAPKQLLPVGGTTMIERVLNAVMASCVDEVVVVLGHAAAQVAQCVPSGCRTVLNENWESGLSTSMQAGLQAIDPAAEAAILVQADQPSVTGEAIDRILHTYYGSTKAIVVPVYHGRRGTPVLFDRRLFSALREVRGDVGGREVLARLADEVCRVEMSSPDVFVDIDTLVDYERYLERGGLE